MKDRLSAIRFELRDIHRQTEDLADKTEVDPQRLQLIQDRLDLIYRLQRKHGVGSVGDLLHIQDEFGSKLTQIENLDGNLEQANMRCLEKEARMLALGKSLTESRITARNEFGDAVVDKLALLGMPNAAFHVLVQEQAPGLDGMDKVVFMFSANKGIKTKPISDVASGGEFSRLMLTIKYLLASKKQMPTIIFDEIDTGISGEVAHNVSEMLEGMAHTHQLFAITHLPQMASKGQSHFFVYKDNSDSRTVSRIKKLDKEERVSEIAQMIGGKTPSDSAKLNARELLGNKKAGV